MALARAQGFIQDVDGNRIAGALVSFYNEQSGALTNVRGDRDGATTIGSSVVSNASGYWYGYLPGGAYRRVAVYNGESHEDRYVAHGTAAEYDIESLLNFKNAQVRVATTANITIATALNNGDTLDGVVLATDDLVLVKDQTTKSQNGVYKVAASPARDVAFDTFDEHAAAMIAVTAGTVNANTLWRCSANIGGVLNTDSIEFVRVTASLTTVAPNPLHLNLAGDVWPTIPHRPAIYADWSNWHWHDPYWTEIRSTAGTYQDRKGVLQTAAAGAPRFHTNYADGQTGLLIEPARTNLALQSQTLETTWALSNILPFGGGSGTENGYAPDRTITAELLTEDTANSSHLMLQDLVKAASAIQYAYSFYVLPQQRDKVFLQFGDATYTRFTQANYDLVAGTVLNNNGGTHFADALGIEQLADGWCRIWLVFTTNTLTTLRLTLGLLDATGTGVYTGTGAPGIRAWGAQLEVGSGPSSYIATTTTSVSRSADVPIRSNADGAISPFEQTVFVEFMPLYALLASGEPPGILGVLDDGGTGNNFSAVRLGQIIAGADFGAISGGVAQADTPSIAIVAGTRYRAAYSSKINGAAFVVDGGAPQIDTGGYTVPADLARFLPALGCSPVLISRAAVFQRGLSNAQMQTVTS